MIDVNLDYFLLDISYLLVDLKINLIGTYMLDVNLDYFLDALILE